MINTRRTQKDNQQKIIIVQLMRGGGGGEGEREQNVMRETIFLLDKF